MGYYFLNTGRKLLIIYSFNFGILSSVAGYCNFTGLLDEPFSLFSMESVDLGYLNHLGNMFTDMQAS